jgi:Protein of unknown function (DUF998)
LADIGLSVANREILIDCQKEVADNTPSESRYEKRHATERLNAIASYITLSSVVYYATAIVLLHVLRSDYDPGYRYLSEYARVPYGALMTSTFFVLSAGSLALSFGLWRSVSSKLHFLPGLLFWLTWACAVFLAGIYTGDVQGTPPTRTGQIHNQMGMIAFPSAAVALTSLNTLTEEERSHLETINAKLQCFRDEHAIINCAGIRVVVTPDDLRL